MNRRPLEQALTSLLPTLTGDSLPVNLQELAQSLLAQSRYRAPVLRAEEEVARTYACAHIACERMKSALDLPKIEVRPPAPPRVYKKVLQYFESVLTAGQSQSQQQQQQQQQLQLQQQQQTQVQPGRGPKPQIEIPTGPTPAPTSRRTRAAARTRTETQTTGAPTPVAPDTPAVPTPASAVPAGPGAGSSWDPYMPAWTMPAVRRACAAAGVRPGAAAGPIFAGVQSVARPGPVEPVKRGRGRRKAVEPEPEPLDPDEVAAVVTAVTAVGVRKMKGAGGVEEAAADDDAVAAVVGKIAAAVWRCVGKVPADEPVDEDAVAELAGRAGRMVEEKTKEWESADWYENLREEAGGGEGEKEEGEGDADGDGVVDARFDASEGRRGEISPLLRAHPVVSWFVVEDGWLASALARVRGVEA